MISMDSNETQLSIAGLRVILACLAILAAMYGLDVPLPVI